MAYPTLKERVRDVLLGAGFAARETTLPAYAGGGTFDLTSGAGVRVCVSWWDSAPDQRRALLARFAGVLRDAGLEVTDLGERLYVAEPEKRSDEERELSAPGAEPLFAAPRWRRRAGRGRPG